MIVAERVKRGFIAGLALVAPLFITIVAFQLLFSWLRGVIDPVVEGTGLARYTGNVPYLPELIALVLLFLVVALLGYLAQRSLGASLFATLDRGLALVPLFSVVYTGVRQVSDALMSQESRFESVVMVEYPREGIYALGFATAESPTPVSEVTGEPTYNIYFPNSPNPTNGHLGLVPESQITELDMSVGQGVRVMVTMGIAEDESEVAELREEVATKVTETDMDLDEAFEELESTDDGI